MNHPQPAKRVAPPRHHPAPESLAFYAAGTLRAGFDLVVAAHLEACARCRDEVARFERLGGQLISELDPAALGDNALAATLARLDEPALDSPPPSTRALGQLLSEARRRWVAPGVWSARVTTPHHRGDRVYLLRVAPGAQTARHGHSGAEFTQVLEGALDDGGTIYRAGDFVELDQDCTHHPRVHGNKACLCLFATEGRLVPTGLPGRIAFAIAGV